MPQFLYSDSSKRYHTLSYYHRQRFGGRVVKVPLNAGFTCPNIDGTCGVGGCSYCSPSGSGEFAGNPAQHLLEQYREGMGKTLQKWPEAAYIAYFQAHTNTHGSIQRLRECFEPFVGRADVRGISIATRADCLPNAVLDYLEDLGRRTYLTVELGLQSTFDETGRRINRCHTYAQFVQAVEALSARGIRVCVHLINGLPGETHEMMVENVRRLSELPIGGIKLHLLHLIAGTKMAREYAEGQFATLELEEYVQIVCDQLEWLRPDIVIERLTGDGEAEQLIAPLWSRDKRRVLNRIDQELARRDSWQGKRRTSL